MKLHAVIHEAALHAHVGDEEIMRGQLLRLIEASGQPHVVIQVFPYEAGMFSAFSGPFTVFGGSSPELDTVLVEQPVQSTVVRDSQGTVRYEKLFAELSRLALPAVDPETLPESNEGRSSLGLVQHLLYSP